MKHIPALDGVRGVAILLVILFHLHIPGLSLGWAGVPLFFVLSGFLITGILIADKQEKAFARYIRDFYWKRTLRIFPLFYLYLVLNISLVIGTGRSLEGYIWYLLYVQNYYIGFQMGNGGATPGMLGHTWSLAVEEQFYLLWPVLVYFLSRRLLIIACVVLILAAPAARWAILETTSNPFMSIVTLPSWLDTMAYGALLAILRTSNSNRAVPRMMFIAGSALVGYAIYDLGLEAFWRTQDWTKSAFYLPTGLAFFFGYIIWKVTDQANKTFTRLFSNRPLMFTGRISYGLYIWHYPAILTIERLASKFHILSISPVFQVLSLIVSYIIAILSYKLFELRFLKLKDKVAKTLHPAMAKAEV